MPCPDGLQGSPFPGTRGAGPASVFMLDRDLEPGTVAGYLHINN